MPFSLFLSLIILQAGNSYMRFGNPMITLTGITDVCVAISLDCLRIPAGLSPRRAPYLSVYQMVHCLYRSCFDNSVPGIFGLQLASAGVGR